MTLKQIRSNSGFILSSALVGVGILAIIFLASAAFFVFQSRANNFLEFKERKEQLRLAILGQFLTNPVNCKCLFAGASTFPNSGTPALTGYAAPSSVGRFAASNCVGGVIDPLIDTIGTTGIILSSVSLSNIALNGDTYDAHLLISVKNAKGSIGSTVSQLDIPVAVTATETAPGTMTFNSCENMGLTLPYLPQVFAVTCRHFLACDTQAQKICAQMMGSPNYCLKDVYSDFVDGGTANSNIKGYTCSVGLCGGGTNTSLTFPYVGSP